MGGSVAPHLLTSIMKGKPNSQTMHSMPVQITSKMSIPGGHFPPWLVLNKRSNGRLNTFFPRCCTLNINALCRTYLEKRPGLVTPKILKTIHTGSRYHPNPSSREQGNLRNPSGHTDSTIPPRYCTQLDTHSTIHPFHGQPPSDVVLMSKNSSNS